MSVAGYARANDNTSAMALSLFRTNCFLNLMVTSTVNCDTVSALITGIKTGSTCPHRPSGEELDAKAKSTLLGVVALCTNLPQPVAIHA